MAASFSVRAVELLSSRICHDLVSPVGAINNGVELIEESGLAEAGEAFDLVADSADAAAKRLKLFRLAFGAGGQDATNLADARAVLEGWLRGGKVAVRWNAGMQAGPPRGFVKLLLTTCLVMEEAMPRGGSLTVDITDQGATLLAEGTGADLRPEVRVVLDGPGDDADLTPRGIVAHVARVFAAQYGLTLAFDQPAPGQVRARLAV